MTEAALLQKCRKLIQKRRPRAWVVKLADRFTRGLPDLLVVDRNSHGVLCVMALEFKSEKGRQTKLQKVTEEKINEIDMAGKATQGWICYAVIRSADDMLMVLGDMD